MYPPMFSHGQIKFYSPGDSVNNIKEFPSMRMMPSGVIPEVGADDCEAGCRKGVPEGSSTKRHMINAVNHDETAGMFEDSVSEKGGMAPITDETDQLESNHVNPTTGMGCEHSLLSVSHLLTAIL